MLEETSEFRSEYLDGQIIPMPGGARNHNRIISNIYRCLGDTLDDRDDSELFIADMRLWIPQTRTHTYPDLMVVCGDLQMLEGRQDTVMNPRLVVEVLSDSTKDYDRGEQFRFYRSIPSFSEYLLVEQSTYHVEHFAKNTQGQWVLTDYDDLEASINLTSLDCSVTLRQVYRKVTVAD